ncbi:MAG: hypothetical protein RLZZ500_1420 [Bacteroidota bacterium]|jgi:hypothetical protein
MNAFLGKKLCIATAHHKEIAIASVVEQGLGVECVVPAHLDTDSLGTFSGEISRKGNVLETLRAKCTLAMKKNPTDLVLASEGSFGAHPSSPFLPADYEMVLLVDVLNGKEYTGSYWTTDTNFSAAIIQSEDEMEAFLNRVGFPSHGVLLRKDAASFDPIFKGITAEDKLWHHYHYLKDTFGTVYAETDMRAMYNPKRMFAIGKATENLVANLKSLCPSCQAPGFSILKMESGLPCAWCKQPTRSPLFTLRQCGNCGWEQHDFYPHQKKEEEPDYCDYCNP